MARYERQIEESTFRAIEFADGSCPFLEWFLGLSKREQAKVEAAFQNLATSLSSRGSDGGRIDNIGSETVRAIYVTRQGQTPPHLRTTIPIKRDGSTFWLIHGFKKQKNKTPSKERRRAENLLARWEKERHDT